MSSTKDALRTEWKCARDAVLPAMRKISDTIIASRVRMLDAYEHGRYLFVYHSFGSEVDTHTIIEHGYHDGKIVILPRCDLGERTMSWYKVTEESALVKNRMGIMEPLADPDMLVDPLTIDGARSLALVPGLLFDRKGYRLGYGGGYYDDFLRGFPGASVGLARAAQLTDDLATMDAVESFDVPLNALVTEAGIIYL